MFHELRHVLQTGLFIVLYPGDHGLKNLGVSDRNKVNYMFLCILHDCNSQPQQ